VGDRRSDRLTRLGRRCGPGITGRRRDREQHIAVKQPRLQREHRGPGRILEPALATARIRKAENHQVVEIRFCIGGQRIEARSPEHGAAVLAEQLRFLLEPMRCMEIERRVICGLHQPDGEGSGSAGIERLLRRRRQHSAAPQPPRLQAGEPTDLAQPELIDKVRARPVLDECNQRPIINLCAGNDALGARNPERITAQPVDHRSDNRGRIVIGCGLQQIHHDETRTVALGVEHEGELVRAQQVRRQQQGTGQGNEERDEPE
jgi:hypothetical protein